MAQDDVVRAAAQARDRIAAEAADKAARDRAKARRARVMKVLFVGMFAVMVFERAVSGGWLHL